MEENPIKINGPQIFFLVFLVDADVVATWLQLVVRQLAEHFEIGREIQLQTAFFQIVLLDPNQRIVEFGVNRLDIFGRQLFAQHALVERQREGRIDETPMVQSLLLLV